MWLHWFFSVQSCPLFLKGLDHDGQECLVALLVPRQSQLLSLLDYLGFKGEIHQYKCQKSGCQGERTPRFLAALKCPGDHLSLVMDCSSPNLSPARVTSAERHQNALRFKDSHTGSDHSRGLPL